MSQIQSFKDYNQPKIYGIYCIDNASKHRAYSILKTQVPNFQLLDCTDDNYIDTPVAQYYFFNIYKDDMDQPIDHIYIQKESHKSVYHSSIFPHLIDKEISAYPWRNWNIQTFHFAGNIMAIDAYSQEETERILVNE